MKKILIIIFILFLSFNIDSFAQGDLLITQKRVVFEGNKQKEALDLVNIGNDTAIYSVTFVQFYQTENGSYIAIDKPDSSQMQADPYLRIFPRIITLAPKEPQVVMLQYRRKNDMKAGEYRSHLYFRSLNNNKPLVANNNDTTLLSINLKPIYGITIPIIIRTGEVNMNVSLNNLKFEIQNDTNSLLKLTINRIGNISSYGQLVVEYIPKEGKPIQIGLLKNIAVFTCINKRNVVIPLYGISKLNITDGKLVVRYTSPNDVKKQETFAENEIEIKYTVNSK